MRAEDQRDNEAGAEERQSAGAARARARRLLAYGGAAVASMLVAVVALRLWRADLRVPLEYRGDALAFGMWVKSVVDNGWYLTTPQVGAPGVLTMHDFPIADAFHLLIIKIMSWASGDWALLFNLYFLLGFPLITLSALAVFRQFGVSFAPALVGSLLYAFLPSRLLRGEGHFFLDVFYQVPLAIMVVLWVCGDDPPLYRDRGPGRWPGLELRGRRTLAALAICALTSTTGIYYAFFAGALMLLGGVWSSIERRTARNALAGAALTAVIVVGLGLQLLPTVIYQRRQGPNPQVATRQHFESEIYGLRVTQLLLPVSAHRVRALRDLKERYDRSAPNLGESSSTSLGMVASAGFLALLALALLRPRPERFGSELLRTLAVLNLLAVLLATTGGFGSLFALLATPEIRAYSRMHVLIAFFALFAVVVLLERLGRHWRLGSLRLGSLRLGSLRLDSIFLVLLLGLGLLDQVTPAAARPYHDEKVAYQRDADLVRRIEAAVPPGAMIFELPFMPFPEGRDPPGSRRTGYDPLRPSFHSRVLRWSYPTMEGRAEAAWVSATAALPPGELIARLSDAGFAGVLVDRWGYRDGGVALQAALASELGSAPIVGADDRLVFLDLTAYTGRTQAALPADERERRRDLALHPVLIRWLDGFYGLEREPNGPFHWCSGSCSIDLENDAQVAQSGTLTMTVVAAVAPATVTIEGELLSATLRIGNSGELFARALTVAPGHHRMSFRSDGLPARVPNEPRTLVWRANNPRFDEIPPGSNPR